MGELGKVFWFVDVLDLVKRIKKKLQHNIDR
jgi:hypothetical protein